MSPYFPYVFDFKSAENELSLFTNEAIRSKKPPAMRVRVNGLTKELTFPIIEVSKPLLRKER